MPFDPSQPFTVVDEGIKSGFDPSKPFTVVNEPEAAKPKPGYEPYQANMADVGISGGEFENVQPVELPPFGKPGTFTRGVSKSLTGAVKFGTSTPGVVAAPLMAVPVVGPTLATGLSAMALWDAAKKTKEAIQTGSWEPAGEAVVTGTLGALGAIGGIKGLRESARTLPKATAEIIETVAQSEPVQATPEPEFQFSKERWLGTERQLVAPRITMPEFSESTLTLKRPEMIGPERQLAAPRVVMPEFSESSVNLNEPDVAPASRQLAAPRTILPEKMPIEENPILTHGVDPGEVISRITLPLESESAKAARKIWSKPIDPSEQAQGSDALRQLVRLTEETKTPGQPYQPPTVSVDLRQLEAMMKRNTVSKVESWADGVIQDKLRNASSNPFLDPEFMAAAATKGAILFKRGVTKFADWQSAMREQFGRGLDPLLAGIYKESSEYWKNKPAPAAPEQAPPTEAPTAATVSQGEVPGVAAPVEPTAISETKPLSQPTQGAVTPQPEDETAVVETPSLEAAAKPPTTNASNGGTRPPPPGSAFDASSIPPEDPPWTVQAYRLARSFRDWWERVWPRSWAATRIQPDTPVITEHQRFLFSPLEFMRQFSQSKWWQALDHWDDGWLVQFEDEARTKYHERIGAGDTPDQAKLAAYQVVPESMQAVFAERDARYPMEVQWAEELGVEPPDAISGPYLARRTTEEGKNVIDVPKGAGNWGGVLRKTLGSFARSRTHDSMKQGMAAGTRYEPIRQAVWMREIYSHQLEATANFVRAMKEKGVLFDTAEEARAAGGEAQPYKVRGLGGKDYYARSRQEARFIEQNFDVKGRSPLAQIYRLANTYGRNPNLVNPLPHTTKNMFFKYVLARVGNFKFKADTAEFKSATPSELLKRFNEVMPISESGERLPNLTAKEVGTWGEKVTSQGLGINDWSSKFIFGKADPAMRYSLWKSYVRKGMSDQAAANHVWLDLVRYDENSGGINFWKAMPFNFFVPWRLGTYLTLAKAMRAHPVRSLAFIGAVEYLREERYRHTGRWTHLPVDYLDAPLAEAIGNPKTLPGIAATTLLFGPGGGQAPTTIKDVMGAIHGDPQNRSRLLNMFWGLSQIYEMPREFEAFQKSGNPQHLVNILTSAALSEHSALKYSPRRLMQWLPEWMPGMQKAGIVREAERLQQKIQSRAQKAQTTYETRHGVSATFERSPESQQLEELRRAAGERTAVTR